jgi:hypothetical protein
MEIRWPNVASFTLLTLIVVWAVREQNAIVSLLSNLGRMGPEHPTDERLYSLMVFSLLAVIVVAIVRIFVHNRDSE